MSPLALPSLRAAVVAGLLVVLGGAARADEIIVLDNGAVLRGDVVREDADHLEVSLAGFREEARVRVERSRIVERRSGRSPLPPRHPLHADEASLPADWSARAKPVDPMPPIQVFGPGPHAGALPAEEPPAEHEAFFSRLVRVIRLSIPRDRTSRSALAVLLLMALVALVGMGGRLGEIETMGLVRTTLLAFFLGAILSANVFMQDVLLRADRAVWVLPLEALVWTLAALAVLRCGLGRAVLLLAFVMFSLGVVVFTAGAVLVTF
jgi:hypothetical protein